MSCSDLCWSSASRRWEGWHVHESGSCVVVVMRRVVDLVRLPVENDEVCWLLLLAAYIAVATLGLSSQPPLVSAFRPLSHHSLHAAAASCCPSQLSHLFLVRVLARSL